ncbi:MAG: deoxyribonuclease I, partial [Pirellulales bacterium]|nr:deoxyribonuclease I [Pirellulales bacterium]
MSESERGNPIQVVVVVLLMVGGGWYFFRQYKTSGLDTVTDFPPESLPAEQSYISYRDQDDVLGAAEFAANTQPAGGEEIENPFDAARRPVDQAVPEPPANVRAYKNIRIAAWALDGFGPTKLANAESRRNFARVARKFDILALQQVASIERDLIPRMVDVINEGQNRYDYVVGQPVGPRDRPEQLAFIFDTTQVRVDRSQTYTLDDPQDQFSFEPLVAWFRAAKPPAQQAWTFSLVNLRIDLARAPAEVAQLPQMMAAVRGDGRGEDDVILAGLFQADDAYLIPTMGGQQIKVAVRSLPTDIFGRYQTSNLVIDGAASTEYLGRGGVYDFARDLELNAAEAETVT